MTTISHSCYPTLARSLAIISQPFTIVVIYPRTQPPSETPFTIAYFSSAHQLNHQFIIQPRSLPAESPAINQFHQHLIPIHHRSQPPFTQLPPEPRSALGLVFRPSLAENASNAFALSEERLVQLGLPCRGWLEGCVCVWSSRAYIQRHPIGQVRCDAM